MSLGRCSILQIRLLLHERIILGIPSITAHHTLAFASCHIDVLHARYLGVSEGPGPSCRDTLESGSKSFWHIVGSIYKPDPNANDKVTAMLAEAVE